MDALKLFKIRFGTNIFTYTHMVVWYLVFVGRRQINCAFNLKVLPELISFLSHLYVPYSNKQKMREILNMHLVGERYSADKIRAGSGNNQVSVMKKGFEKFFLNLFYWFVPVARSGSNAS